MEQAFPGSYFTRYEYEEAWGFDYLELFDTDIVDSAGLGGTVELLTLKPCTC
jgi:hypothetical protein